MFQIPADFLRTVVVAFVDFLDVSYDFLTSVVLIW